MNQKVNVKVVMLKEVIIEIEALTNNSFASNAVQEAISNSMKDFEVLVYNPNTEFQWRSRIKVYPIY